VSFFAVLNGIDVLTGCGGTLLSRGCQLLLDQLQWRLVIAVALAFAGTW
jgi:hypothetical protein